MKFPTLLCGAFITGNWLNEKKLIGKEAKPSYSSYAGEHP